MTAAAHRSRRGPRRLSALLALCLPVALTSLAARPAAATGLAIGIDGTSNLGPAQHSASGLLDDDSLDPSRSQALQPRTWRASGVRAEYTDLYNAAHEHGAQVMWSLGDDWSEATGNYQPWLDWTGYENFIRWDVSRHMHEFPVDWFDIQNEPEGYAPGGGTKQQYLDMYVHAYRAIKSVDPGARITAPSISQYQTTPYSYTCTANASCAGQTLVDQRLRWIDLGTWMDYAAANSIAVDAITWHEICMGAEMCPANPHDLETHMTTVRAMIASRPALGSPQAMVNEYLPPQIQDVPSWVVGYLSAFENVGAPVSVHSCWNEPDGLNECFSGNLDGLVARDGTTPRDSYWVYKAYAEMTGAHITSTVPGNAYSAFATRDDAHQEIRVLLGRHETSCSNQPNQFCAAPAPLPAASVNVAVAVPWAVGSVGVTLQTLPRPAVNYGPNTTGFASAGTMTLPVVGGTVSVPLSVADGDAWEVTLDAAAPAPPPAVPPMGTSYCPLPSCLAGSTAGAFSPTGSMYYPRSKAQAVALQNGRVLVTGGYYNFGTRPWTKLYDPATGTWTASGTESAGRQDHTVTLLHDGRVLAAGGFNQDSGNLIGASELYDPSSGRWSASGGLITPRDDHTATLLADGRVLMAGGYASVSGSYVATATAEIYNPATGLFTATGSLSTARAGATATLLQDGRVLVAGGTPSNGVSLASAEIYDPATGLFSPTGSLATARAFHTATLLGDGRVLVAGGGAPLGNGRPASASGGAPLAQADISITGTTEVFTPATGLWTAAGSITPRSRHTATALADGRVLVTGGITSDGTYLASSQLFDPATGWTGAGAMSTSRAFHTATLLSTGNVLVAGGDDALASPDDRYAFEHTQSSAELFTAVAPRGAGARHHPPRLDQ